MKERTLKHWFNCHKIESGEKDTFECNVVSQEIFTDTWDVPEYLDMIVEMERAMKYAGFIEPKKVWNMTQ